MLTRNAKLLRCLAVAAFASIGTADAQTLPCPTSNGGQIVFSDGSILMQTPFAVNPDGAVASYTIGDHGFTYIANGVNLLDHGSNVICSHAGNGLRCHNKWLQAEAGAFGPGTPEFCVFAMDVEPSKAAARKVPCTNGSKDRFVVGNGKGRPVRGPLVKSFSGETVGTYVSTTSLRHTRGGEPVYVDSAAIPGVVVPRIDSGLVGAIVWVRYRDHDGFAIVNDTGPAFGEGTVALHQLLENGKIGPLQPVGPIPANLRCTEGELGLKAPFVVRPPVKSNLCRPGYVPKTAAEIRAYGGIREGVTSIILAKVKPPMKGWTVTQEITSDRLAGWAEDAGYTQGKLNQMAGCLPHTK